MYKCYSYHVLTQITRHITVINNYRFSNVPGYIRTIEIKFYSTKDVMKKSV